ISNTSTRRIPAYLDALGPKSYSLPLTSCQLYGSGNNRPSKKADDSRRVERDHRRLTGGRNLCHRVCGAVAVADALAACDLCRDGGRVDLLGGLCAVGEHSAWSRG